jgi:hypothetical protein
MARVVSSPRPSSRRTLGVALTLFVSLAVLTVLAGGQDSPTPPADWASDAPAHLVVLTGAVTIERDGRAQPADPNEPLLTGDRLRTERGRAEVLFGDGSVLDVDQYSAVDLLSDSLLRLRAGRVRLSIVRLTDELAYRVDAAGASAVIRAAGEYRLTLSDPRAAVPELDVAVIRGSAELSNADGRTLVRAGTHAIAGERAEPSIPYVFNSSTSDAFDRWADDQRDARVGAQSTPYLPGDLRYYGGQFDQSGSWQNDPAYGSVWYPRVAATWRPYYDGRWSVMGSAGWVWVGVDAWSWPTHHYGRWGNSSGRWFWIPGRQWGPAWVSWAVSPTYVSWCPLGFDGRPVVAGGFSRGAEPWSGWVVVPANSLRPNMVVSNYVVAQPVLTPVAWSQFVASPSAPPMPVGRTTTAPLRSPTAVRRSAGPSRAPAGAPMRDVRQPASQATSPPASPPPATSRGSVFTPNTRNGWTEVGPPQASPAPTPAPGRTPPRTNGPSRTPDASRGGGSAVPRYPSQSAVDAPPPARLERPDGRASLSSPAVPPPPRVVRTAQPAVPRVTSPTPPRVEHTAPAPPPRSAPPSRAPSGTGRGTAVKRGGGSSPMR